MFSCSRNAQVTFTENVEQLKIISFTNYKQNSFIENLKLILIQLSFYYPEILVEKNAPKLIFELKNNFLDIN